MRLHKKGYGPIAVVLAILLLIAWLINVFFPFQTIVHYILYGIGFVFYILVVRFFRHPLRNVAVNENHIMGAADGVVVAIEEVYESQYYHDKRLQISVFMSPLNVHVNWYPISGEIIYTKYFKGRYHAAYLPKASSENERMSIVIENEQQKSVMMVQIAGLMARRVYTNAKEGNYVFQGEEAGIIKFGSRVDLILPLNVDVMVELNQKVRACSTIIAKFKP